MYLYTERVLQLQIDDYINSTSIKQLGGKIAIGCFDYFFRLISIMITTHFN